MKTAVCIGVLLGFAAVNAIAQDEEKVTLKVGSTAPALQTGKWVQGAPVKEFAKDKIYLVEFWATWCGPCKVSIPHLNDLHKKYQEKGLVVIGQDCWERDESKVEPFIKDMGEKMTYRVALDDKSDEKNGAMAKTWMAAAGRNGIPSAFLVDKNQKIAWIGHPMQLKDQTVEGVLAGTYDLKQAAAEAEKEKKAEDANRKLSQQLSQAMRDKDWEKADSLVNDMGKEMKLGDDALNSVRFQIQMAKGDLDAAAGYAEKMSDGMKDNAMGQNQLAWTLLTKEGCKGKALDIATKIAERANDDAAGKDAAILDTLARARFMQNKKEEALALQKKAVELADGDMKDELKKTLESYEAGKLPAAD